MTAANIRLACVHCDRSDRDGITPEDLDRCIAEGWEQIEEVQSYEEATRTYDRPEDAPPGFNLTAWYTHSGICPECRDV